MDEAIRHSYTTDEERVDIDYDVIYTVLLQSKLLLPSHIDIM